MSGLELGENLVSIVIPVYNAELYVEQCISSILEQTFDNIEIIIVDDGSTDSSLEICRRIAYNRKNILVHHQENQGVSVARNEGMRLAKGEWICFIDPDDWIEREYVEQLLYTAIKENADICICDTYIDCPDKIIKKDHFNHSMIFEKRDEIDDLQLQLIAKIISANQPNSGELVGAPWGKIYRRSFLDENGLTYVVGLKRSQDCIFNLYAFQVANRIVYIKGCLYHYRHNDVSVCNKFLPDIVSIVKHYLDELNKFIIRNNKDERFIRAYNVKIVTSLYKCFFLSVFNERNGKGTAEQVATARELVKQQPFCNAIKEVKLADMSFSEKIFTICIKCRFFFIIKILMLLREKMK